MEPKAHQDKSPRIYINTPEKVMQFQEALNAAQSVEEFIAVLRNVQQIPSVGDGEVAADNILGFLHPEYYDKARMMIPETYNLRKICDKFMEKQKAEKADHQDSMQRFSISPESVGDIEDTVIFDTDKVAEFVRQHNQVEQTTKIQDIKNSIYSLFKK
jgi:hypothetical protein